MAKLLHVVIDSGVNHLTDVHHWINPNFIVRIHRVSNSPNLWSVVLQEANGLTLTIDTSKYIENKYFIDVMTK